MEISICTSRTAVATSIDISALTVSSSISLSNASDKAELPIICNGALPRRIDTVSEVCVCINHTFREV